QLPVEVLVAAGSIVIPTAIQVVGSRIPIVMITSQDPVAAGYIASLARPGGNVTGPVYGVGIELNKKRIELLAQCAPAIQHLGILANGSTPGSAPGVEAVQAAATHLGIRTTFLDLRSPA